MIKNKLNALAIPVLAAASLTLAQGLRYVTQPVVDLSDGTDWFDPDEF